MHGRLVVQSLGRMLATMGPEHWGRCWRLGGLKIGDDTEGLAAERLGKTLNTYGLEDWG